MDKEKVIVIKYLPHPTTIKTLRGFLVQIGFNRRLEKNFDTISKPFINIIIEKLILFLR